MYLTQSEYTDITGKTTTEDKLRLASHLLDARIGAYCTLANGYKLDKSRLNEKQTFIVEQWVAEMAKTVTDTGGAVQQGADSISIGRFDVDYGGITANDGLVPESLRYYDQLLVDSDLINRKLRIKRSNERCYF